MNSQEVPHGIVTFPKVGVSEAYQLSIEGFNYLVQREFTQVPGWLPFEWNHPCLVYYDDGAPVGILVYEHIEHQDCFYIGLAYVEPSSGQKGIFTELYEELRRIAVLQKVGSIVFETHVNNDPMNGFAKKMEIEARSTTYAEYL